MGYAGTGKSITIRAAKSFLHEVNGIHIAPTSMTMASMADILNESKCSMLRPGHSPPLIEYNSLHLLADELSALVHKYDLEFMAGLTTLYDGDRYAQARRGKDLRIEIKSPTLNILAGTTPSNLCQFMPEGAWDQGFASRIVMVYSGDREVSDIFALAAEGSGGEDGYKNLLHDLSIVYGLYGQFSIDPSAVEAFREWRTGGEQPTPSHPKLVHYCSRRTAHVLKLCMVASVSRGNDLIITLADFELARSWLLGAELTMADVFTAGITGGDSSAIEEAWYFIFARWSKTKRAIPEHELVHFVRERVPSHSVMRVIDIMERDGSITRTFDPLTGQGKFEPGPRKAV